MLTLARFLKQKEKKFPVKAIFTSSENLYEGHRKEIEESFKAPVFELYGQAERVVVASECPSHKGMHINPEYGVLEFIDHNGEVSRQGRGEVVGTGLNNYAMPLIRYRTGDTARLAQGACPCGRKMPLLQTVEGRISDHIMTPDGRVIPGSGIMGAFHGIKNIKTSQLIQEDIDNILVNIIKEHDSEEVEIDRLKFNIKKCLGNEVSLKVKCVESLSNKKSAKQRWVISNVDKDTFQKVKAT